MISDYDRDLPKLYGKDDNPPDGEPCDWCQGDDATEHLTVRVGDTPADCIEVELCRTCYDVAVTEVFKPEAIV